MSEQTGPKTRGDNPIGVFPPVEAIFPGTDDSFLTFSNILSGLSLTDALIWCARISLILTNPSNRNVTGKQQYAVGQFFPNDAVERLNSFVSSNGGLDKVVIFHRGQLLELIRWIVLLCRNSANDGTSFSDPHIQIDFARAALIANSVWARRVYGQRFSLDGGTQAGRRRAMGAIRKSIEGTSGESMHQMEAVGRGHILFCRHFQDFYQGAGKDFFKATGLELEQYYVCLTAFAANYLDRTPDKVLRDPNQSGLFNIHSVAAQHPQLKDIVSRFISLESQTSDELRSALWGTRTAVAEDDAGRYDYKALRQRPIFRASDGRAIILDSTFFSEKALIGPLFHLVNANPEKQNEIFGAFGRTFEKYVSNKLTGMFPTGSGPLSRRLTCGLQGDDDAGNQIEVADAWVSYPKEAVLFEFKATWLRDDTILSDDFEIYINQLQAKYAAPKGLGGSKTRPLGVCQLSRAISHLSSGHWKAYGIDFGEVERIFPVLLVHDELLDSPTYGAFLASEFQKDLIPDEIMEKRVLRKGGLLIEPLILMTIGDLEHLATSVERFSFRDLLNDYSATHPDRLVSLNNFLAASKYAKELRHDSGLAAEAIDLLNKTLQRMHSSPSHAAEFRGIFPPEKRALRSKINES